MVQNPEEFKEITVKGKNLVKGYQIDGQFGLVGSTYTLNNPSARIQVCKTVSQEEAPNFKKLFEREQLAQQKLNSTQKETTAWRYAGVMEMFQIVLLDDCYKVVMEVYIKNLQEYMNNESAQMQKSFSVVTCCLRQLFLAVGFLHRQGIYQRQLAPASFAITKYVKEDDEFSHIRVSIGDFSLCMQSNLDKVPIGDEYVGIFEAMPPEIAQKKAKNLPLSYDLALAETWQLGCLMYYVSHGVHPFKSKNIERLVHDQGSKSRSKMLQTRFRQPSDDDSKWVYIFRKVFAPDADKRNSLLEIYRSGKVNDIVKGACSICGM